MPSQEVCAANAVTRQQGIKACVSSCTYIPEVEPKFLICAIEDDVDLVTVKPGLLREKNGSFTILYDWFSA
jgi:hypothetical protein